MSDNQYINDCIEAFEIQEYIATGGESIVFKGIKKNVGRTYALKFQPDDRYYDFRKYILPIHQKLEQSGVSRIAGLIPAVPAPAIKRIFDMIPPSERKPHLFPTDGKYFCIVEDYINGCTLQEYCHGNFQKRIEAHCPSKSASYGEVLEFQKTIFNWIVQFCDIMTNVTDENGIIHLDIKPQNIMITDDTKSLILIDLGMAMELDRDKKYNLNDVIFAVDRVDDKMVGNIGTANFAAPEAHHPNANNKPPLSRELYGHVDQRSDIFSFGATLWHCLTPNQQVRGSINPIQYYNRDLFCAPAGYSKELENILIKCTRREPIDRYQDFRSLKEAALEAEKKLPSSYQTRKKRRGLAAIASLLFVFGFIFLFLNIRSNSLEVNIAEKAMEELVNVESDTNSYQQKAEALLKVKPDRSSFETILKKTYGQGTNDTINLNETKVLVGCLEYATDGNKDIIPLYINTIIENAYENQMEAIAETVCSNNQAKKLEQDSCDGLLLATILHHLKNKVVSQEAYTALQNFCHSDKKRTYRVVLSAILNKLITQTDLQETLVKELTNKSKTELKNELKKMTKDIDALTKMEAAIPPASDGGVKLPEA